MANISQTRITTIITLIIPPIDSSREITTIFIDILWEINLRGRNVLRSLSIFITGIFTDDTLNSIQEKTTINMSS
jgi:hypothetical protein